MREMKNNESDRRPGCKDNHRSDEWLDKDLGLLRRAGVAPDDVSHCERVRMKALDIAGRIDLPLNLELVSRGGLLHDLGKAKGRADDHGYLGAQLGRDLGLPEEILRIMETHVKAGLSEEEALEAGIPVKDYTPRTLEEKIVVYADKLVDILSSTEKVVSSEIAAERLFEEILRNNPRLSKSAKAAERQIRNHLEIQSLMRQNS